MIAWKCDYGYSSSLDLSVGNVTWTDTGKLFSFASVNEIPTSMLDTVLEYPTFQAGYDELVNLIGIDVNRIYGCLVKEGDSYINSAPASNWLPSFISMAPILADVLRTSGAIGRYTVYRFPTIGKVFSLYKKSPSSNCQVRIFDLDYNLLHSETISFVVDVSALEYSDNPLNVGPNITIGAVDENNNYYSIRFALLENGKSWITIRLVNPDDTRVIYNQVFLGQVPDSRGEPINPYEPVEPSGPAGGGGNFDDSSDPITGSPLPTLSCADTGFTRIYNPTLSQLQDLARYLWTDESVLQTIWNRVKQFFENPMSAIISLSIVPVAVPDGGVEDFKLMYFSTGVNMNTAANQFVDVDCGTINIAEYYGSALDYAPNTKITCYLPFIGNVQLNVDEVMGTTLQVKYRVDIVSGACVAQIIVNGNYLYAYTGHCAVYIPVTAGDFSTYQAALIGIAKTALTAVGAATGGSSGAIIGSLLGGTSPKQETSHNVVSYENKTTQRNPSTGRQITMGTESSTKTSDSVITTEASFSGLAARNISNTVGQVIGSKPVVEHSGAFTGNSGYLGVRYPFVIIERPRLCRPDNYQSLNGFPCMMTLKLSACSGFTQVQQVQLTNIPCTNPESAEILELLKSGVIL